MVFKGHVSIIPHHIDTPFLNPPRRQIPGAGVNDVRFGDLLAIHKEFPVSELDLFPLQGDHAFQEHHPVSGETHGDHVVPFRLRKEIAKLPAEINPSIPISGFHAGSLNPYREEDVPEEQVGENGNETDPDQKPRGQRRKKESANPAVRGHCVQATSICPDHYKIEDANGKSPFCPS
jgi:hypothetical protein